MRVTDVSAQQSPDAMKAVVHHVYGSPDALDIREIDKPAPADDEVLIRVHAAALNAADAFLLSGEPFAVRAMAGGLRRPRTNHVLGRAVAGQIEAVGMSVAGLEVGDHVYAECAGTLAGYVRAPERFVAPKPAALSFEQAATIPVAATAALQGLRDRGQVRAGQRVLINGASGGVGTFAVQIAAWLGARVTGVCSTRNVDLVRSIGADDVIDYTAQDFTTAEQRYDVILDLVGNHSLAALRRALAPTGTLVLSSGGGGRWLGPARRIASAFVVAPFVRQRLRPFAATQDKRDLILLKELAESGAIRPVIDRTYPLGHAVEAMRYLGQGHVAGKLVIIMNDAH
ncbi:NAD(P)-dependent alcohol dehydrogenase [Streptomyces sp. NPDC006208]|uniref:NAD(P)-dependent alcohol dehydrogenase n=1 Tax=Streptomyces sp. NPDC006208 TaxID=3156734 RepID=UPI0033A5DECB